MSMTRALVLLGSLAASNAFTVTGPGLAGLALRNGNGLSPVRATRSTARLAPKMQVEQVAEQATLLASYPEGFVNGMTSYFNLYTPIFKSLNLPPFMLHWFHALNMGTVLFAMGGYGTFLGWYIRNNPQDKMQLAPGPALGKTASDMHSTLMTAMGVIFFLGANGGLVLSLVQNKPITESVHFTTAMIGFAMLAVQGSLTKMFNGENDQTMRTAHAFFGSATMGLFLFHASQGLALGLEYSKVALEAAATAAPNVVASL
jgi:hypothetical protein